jgi:hypothetical protein
MDDIIRAIEDGSDLQKAVEAALALSAAEQEDLLTRIGKARSTRAGAFLTLLYPLLSDKRLKKLVKKDLFRLKTLGIPVEEPKDEGSSVLHRVDPSHDALGLMSNYDAANTRVVLAAIELKRNKFLFSHSIIHFSEGLLQMMSLSVDRQHLEELTRDYVARTHSPMVLASISPPYAGYVIEEASGISGRETDDAKSLNRLLAAAAGNVKRPADVYGLSPEAPTEPASFETVLGDDLFQPFLFGWKGMEQDRKALDEVTNPAIVLPPAMIDERKTAFYRELAEKESVRALSGRFRRMLEDSAYLFFCLKEYPLHAGAIELLKKPDEVKAAFLRFLDKTLREAGKKEQEQQQPGVIIDPYSAGRR